MARAREEEGRRPKSAPSSPTIGKTICDVPTDVINEILLSMDVKTLCRLRCVSRWWNAHISNPHFCLLHYHRSLDRGWLRILQVYCTASKRKPLESDYVFSFTDLFRLEHRNLRAFHYPEKIIMESFAYSCFGMICMNISKALYIYNPTTRKIVTDLPPLDYSIFEPKLALGFVHSTNEFKVVSFCLLSGFKVDCRVLTIPKDLDKGWRPVPSPQLAHLPDLAVADSESAVYALNLIDSGLFRFDLETERWSTVNLPPSVKQFIAIKEFRGSLCLVVSKSQDEIWLLQDGDTWVKKWALLAWTMLFPLHHDEERGRLLIVTIYGELKFYHIEAGTFEEVDTSCEDLREQTLRNHIPYVESFASLSTLRDIAIAKH